MLLQICQMFLLHGGLLQYWKRLATTSRQLLVVVTAVMALTGRLGWWEGGGGWWGVGCLRTAHLEGLTWARLVPATPLVSGAAVVPAAVE
jgi:hypothetical protein